MTENRGNVFWRDLFPAPKKLITNNFVVNFVQDNTIIRRQNKIKEARKDVI